LPELSHADDIRKLFRNPEEGQGSQRAVMPIIDDDEMTLEKDYSMKSLCVSLQ
jgi:hypothetical protein